MGKEERSSSDEMLAEVREWLADPSTGTPNPDDQKAGGARSHPADKGDSTDRSKPVPQSRLPQQDQNQPAPSDSGRSKKRRSKRGDREATYTYPTVADQLGFQIGSRWNSPKIIGRRHGVDITVYYTVGSEGIPAHTHYELKFRDLGLGLRVHKRTSWNAVTNMIHRRRLVETGDEMFHHSLEVIARYPQDAVKFLTPARREAIQQARRLATIPQRKALTVTDTRMAVMGDSRPTGHHLRKAIEELLEAAETLTR